jgi:GNAT superfamily N-acetyltransferase
MLSPAGVLIREMRLADIPAGLNLCRASNWNQTEQDWLYFLKTAPRGALVAVQNGLVIGTVATLPYGPFAWISMVLVDAAARHRGIGTLLLDEGLALVPEGIVSRLDATPAGEVLYRTRGFVAEYGLARLFLDRKQADAAGAALERRLASHSRDGRS